MTARALARTPVSSWLLTSACLVLAILFELGWIQPLRLPGHRALPTVAALLVFSRLLPPVVVAGYSLLAATVITLAHPHQSAPATLLYWGLGAAAVLALRRVERRALAALVFGAGLGLLRALLFASGPAPSGARIAGNVAFGIIGALLALLVMRPVEKT